MGLTGWNEVKLGREINKSDTLMKSLLYKVLTRQIHNIKIKKIMLEMVDNFEVEIVQDYLDMSGGVWYTPEGLASFAVPTWLEIRRDIRLELQKVILNGKAIEYRTRNNFVIFWNGDSISIDYSIIGDHSGSQRKGIKKKK